MNSVMMKVPKPSTFSCLLSRSSSLSRGFFPPAAVRSLHSRFSSGFTYHGCAVFFTSVRHPAARPAASTSSVVRASSTTTGLSLSLSVRLFLALPPSPTLTITHTDNFCTILKRVWGNQNLFEIEWRDSRELELVVVHFICSVLIGSQTTLELHNRRRCFKTCRKQHSLWWTC